MSLVPADPKAPVEAMAALAAADQIILGPGSLFTSVLAAVAVPDVRQGIARSAARKVYVCNLRPQVPETEEFDVGMHVDALAGHGVPVDMVRLRHLGTAAGHAGRGGRRHPRWPGPAAWPTTRSNWRRCSRICSDDALNRPDALAWSPVSFADRGIRTEQRAVDRTGY